MATAKQNTAQIAAELAAPVLSSLGLRLWDVRFEKEGGRWFLRYFIDKEGGVDINDCEQFSRAVDPILDAIRLTPKSCMVCRDERTSAAFRPKRDSLNTRT